MDPFQILGHQPIPKSVENFWLTNFNTNLTVAPEEAQRLKKLPPPKPSQSNINKKTFGENFVMSETSFASRQFSIKVNKQVNLTNLEKKIRNNKSNDISKITRKGKTRSLFFTIKTDKKAEIIVNIFGNGTIQITNLVNKLGNSEIRNLVSKVIGTDLPSIEPENESYWTKFCVYIDGKPQDIDLKSLLEVIRAVKKRDAPMFEHIVGKIVAKNVIALQGPPPKPVQSKRAVTLNVPNQPNARTPTPETKKYYKHYIEGKQIGAVIKFKDTKVHLVISHIGIISAQIFGKDYTIGPDAFKKFLRSINITKDDIGEIFSDTDLKTISLGIDQPKKQRHAAKMQENRAIRMAKNADDISNREKNNFYVHLKLKTLGNGNKPVFSIRQQPNKKSNSFVRERGKLLTSYRSWGMLNLNNISKHTRNVWGINKNVIDKFKGTSAKSAAQSAKKRKRNTQPTFSGILPNASNWIKRVFKKNGTAEILKTSGLPKRELYYPNETPGKKGEYGLLPAGNITKKKEKFIKGLKAQGGRIRDLPKNVKNALKLSNTPNSNSNSNNTNVRELERIMLEAQAESAERKRAAASAERKRAAASAEKKRAAASAERRERIEAAKRQQQINNKRRENQDKLRKLQNNINKMKRKTIESARLATVSGASRQSASPISPPNKQYGTMFNKLGKRKSPI